MDYASMTNKQLRTMFQGYWTKNVTGEIFIVFRATSSEYALARQVNENGKPLTDERTEIFYEDLHTSYTKGIVKQVREDGKKTNDSRAG